VAQKKGFRPVSERELVASELLHAASLYSFLAKILTTLLNELAAQQKGTKFCGEMPLGVRCQ